MTHKISLNLWEKKLYRASFYTRFHGIDIQSLVHYEHKALLEIQEKLCFLDRFSYVDCAKLTIVDGTLSSSAL